MTPDDKRAVDMLTAMSASIFHSVREIGVLMENVARLQSENATLLERTAANDVAISNLDAANRRLENELHHSQSRQKISSDACAAYLEHHKVLHAENKRLDSIVFEHQLTIARLEKSLTSERASHAAHNEKRYALINSQEAELERRLKRIAFLESSQRKFRRTIRKLTLQLDKAITPTVTVTKTGAATMAQILNSDPFVKSLAIVKKATIKKATKAKATTKKA